MLISSSRSLGNRVVSPDEEKERLQCEGFAENEGFKPGMKERVGDGKLIISMTVGGINETRSNCPVFSFLNYIFIFLSFFSIMDC